MQKITVGNIDINYEIQGSGAPLLMIMGLSFSLCDWGDKFTELLAQHYQLILFDNRDTGLTSRSNTSGEAIDPIIVKAICVD